MFVALFFVPLLSPDRLKEVSVKGFFLSWPLLRALFRPVFGGSFARSPSAEHYFRESFNHYDQKLFPMLVEKGFFSNKEVVDLMQK